MEHIAWNPVSSLFQSANQVQDLIKRADDDQETKRLINKFKTLKETRVPFYLTIEDFDEILRWKLRQQYGRQSKYREQNKDHNVRAITQTAFAIQHSDKDYETELRLKLLITLSGVEVPVASAIMTLCYPDRYSVIDFRNWRQIYRGSIEKNYYTPKEYIKYLSIIKQIAANFNITPQEVDMAIWQYDIENHGRE